MCVIQNGELNPKIFKAGGFTDKELLSTKYSNSQSVAELSSQINSTPAESTPPVQRSNPDSGLSIRRSSRSSSNTSNRRGGSRSGARKRFKTT